MALFTDVLTPSDAQLRVDSEVSATTTTTIVTAQNDTYIGDDMLGIIGGVPIGPPHPVIAASGASCHVVYSGFYACAIFFDGTTDVRATRVRRTMTSSPIYLLPSIPPGPSLQSPAPVA